MAHQNSVFPTFAVIVLVVGIIWLLQGLGIIGSFPWIPVILIIIGIGMLVKFYAKRN